MTESAQPLFRIGGVYRNAQGELTKLVQMDENTGALPLKACASPAKAINVTSNGKHGGACGYRSLVDGSDLADYAHDGGDRTLIPGDLTLKDGEWVPFRWPWVPAATEQPQHHTFPSGATIVTQGSTITGRIEPAPEPKRAPLDWNKPTRIDRFPGFVVTKATDPQPGYDLNRNRRWWEGSTQRIAGERDVFGSAHLILKD